MSVKIMPPSHAVGVETPQASSPSGFQHDPGVLRLLRAIAVAGVAILPLVTFAFVWARAVMPLSDPDTWWHLVMGHKYLEGTSVRHPGPMSYFGTEDWHSRDWLTQMVAAQFDGWFGLPGVAWLFGLGIVAFVLVLYRVCRNLVAFPASVIATSMGLLASMTSLTARPQLVSFVFLAVTVGALLKLAADLRPRWWLALLTGVWACMHGMWFLCPSLQVAVLIGLALDRRLDGHSARRLALLPVLSLLAVALTPNGPSLLRQPLGASQEAARYIMEYQPPSVGSLFYLLTLFMLGFTLTSWARSDSKPSWVQVMIALMAAVFAVQMQRTITLGAVLITPLFAQAVDRGLRNMPVKVPQLMERVAVYGGALGALVAIAVVAPSTADQPADSRPVSMDAQLDRIPPSEVLFNELADGGYLRWRHPTLRIVGDGLSDQYDINWLVGWFKADKLAPGWEVFVHRTCARYALLRTETPLVAALKLKKWTVVASDVRQVLLESPEPPDPGCAQHTKASLQG